MVLYEIYSEKWKITNTLCPLTVAL